MFERKMQIFITNL